ncbi:MAG: hypothetical protein KBC57_01855 [Neisseriaceae bacterium]|nr:hypothetical protein [Neisseriaceae bacterium]MBP6861086.1 hypothetical protein [Neisseriaceae bacterium]
MQNKNNHLPPVPQQRYFTLAEVCDLAQIDAHNFEQWQYQNGVVLGYGGNVYSRQDVLKIRQLRASFEPSVDAFTLDQLDTAGEPAIDGVAAKAQLGAILKRLEAALV